MMKLSFGCFHAFLQFMVALMTSPVCGEYVVRVQASGIARTLSWCNAGASCTLSQSSFNFERVADFTAVGTEMAFHPVGANTRLFVVENSNFVDGVRCSGRDCGGAVYGKAFRGEFFYACPDNTVMTVGEISGGGFTDAVLVESDGGFVDVQINSDGTQITAIPNGLTATSCTFDDVEPTGWNVWGDCGRDQCEDGTSAELVLNLSPPSITPVAQPVSQPVVQQPTSEGEQVSQPVFQPVVTPNDSSSSTFHTLGVAFAFLLGCVLAY